MAITDNNFTPEEIDAAITANPELLTHVTGALAKREYFVADKDTKVTYDTNLQNQAKSALTSQHATEVEKKLEEITGIKKTDINEKWTTYYERVAKTLTENDKTLTAQIKALEGKSDITSVERQQLIDLRELAASKDKELTTAKTSHQTEINRLKSENKIYSDISKVDSKLKKDIDPELMTMKKEAVVNEMLNSSRYDGNLLVFLKPDGTAFTNASNGSFMTAEEVYSLKMDKFIDKGKIQPGAGGGPEGNSTEPTVGQLKTKGEVDVFISSKGFLQGTKEFSVEQKKYNYASLPLA